MKGLRFTLAQVILATLGLLVVAVAHSGAGGRGSLEPASSVKAQTRDGHVLHLPVVLNKRSSPFELRSDIGTVTALDAHGSLVVAGSGRSVLVIDLAERGDPRPIARSSILPGRVVDVAVAGDLLAVVVSLPPYRGDGAVVLCDISDPTIPRIVGQLDQVSQPTRVTLAGGIAYVAAHVPGLTLIDVSDRSAPQLLASAGVAVVQDMEVVGDTAYIVGSGRLELLDVSNPESPSEIGRYVGLGKVAELTVSDGLAFVTEAAGGEDGSRVRVVDVSRPSDPMEVAAVHASAQALQVAAHGDTLYLISHGMGQWGRPRIETFDLSDPQQPAAVGHVDLVAYPTLLLPGRIGLMVLDRQLVANTSSSVVVLDLEVPAQPQDPAAVYVGDAPRSIEVVGDRVYQSNWDGLQILDFENPVLPRQAGILPFARFPDLGSVTDIEVAGDRAYVLGLTMDEEYTPMDVLVAIDVSDPTEPRRMDTLVTDQRYHQLTVWGTTLVLYGPSITTVDISDPGRMRLGTKAEPPFPLAQDLSPGGGITVLSYRR